MATSDPIAVNITAVHRPIANHPVLEIPRLTGNLCANQQRGLALKKLLAFNQLLVQDFLLGKMRHAAQRQ
jgi:hypothetical protein